MFSAHLIFGDINNHSKYPMEERIKILNKYWEICEKYKPKNLNKYTFYETDNDAFMVGLSSQDGFVSGYDVLNLVSEIDAELKSNNISVSYGINLMGCTHEVEWKTYRGFVNDLQMIHMPDEIYHKVGAIQRSRIAGDSLILTARLQSLAKKLNVPGCISIYQNGHVDKLDNHKLKNGKRIKSKEITNKYYKLGKEQMEWLTERKIKAYSFEI